MYNADYIDGYQDMAGKLVHGDCQYEDLEAKMFPITYVGEGQRQAFLDFGKLKENNV